MATANVILKITNLASGIKRTLLLYRLIQLFTLPLAIIYFAVRLLTNRGYRPHFQERLGFLPSRFRRTARGSIWLHAVSVGEVASAVPLVRKLRSAQPTVAIYLSTSTTAGRKAAARHQAMLDGIFYLPLDYVSCVRRALRFIRPSLVIVLETEIWPVLYAEVKRAGAQLAIVNGRISNRTWPRYQGAKHFFAPILSLADAVLVQSEEDRNRYLHLGVTPERLAVPGNLKFDAVEGMKVVDIPTFGAKQIWIAASTVGPNERGSSKRHKVDEDDVVLKTFLALANEFPGLLLILAPRQPSRFDIVAEKLRSRRVNHVRRTALKVDPFRQLQLPGVLLLDTIGELGGAFTLADVAFVGGSIAPRGGHNILEPAAAGVPVVIGPHMQNFTLLLSHFLAADAVMQIGSGDGLFPAVRELLRNREHAASLGRRALEVVQRQQGVADRVVTRLWPLYCAAHPISRRGTLWTGALAPLALLWKRGGVAKRRRSEYWAHTQADLPTPVISVGGITVGGSGKTPFADYLATRLRAQGSSPAILTRGYRRRSPAQSLVLRSGFSISPAFTGDEAQIFLRSGAAAVGIGADRYSTAKILLREFPETDILILDDGFQHARLRREFDIVVIDGLDPFGQGELVPLGRLREPLSALERADALVVTRAEDPQRYQAICRSLKAYNPHAAVFRTHLNARRWREYRSGTVLSQLPVRRVGAFCGLGNPQNFWNTLERLGLEVVFRWSFGDHHVYRPTELQRIAHHALASGAQMLVTTEKDRMNCPSHLDTSIAPLDLAWLEIELELEDEESFFRLLQQALERKSKCTD